MSLAWQDATGQSARHRSYRGSSAIADTFIGIRLLGPVELHVNGDVVPCGGPTQRAVLAMLAIKAGQAVAVEDLADGIWGASDEPLSAVNSIQIHVSRLRRVIEQSTDRLISSVTGGYRLDSGRNVLIDAHDLERRLAEGRALLRGGDAAAAASVLRTGLDLRRGPALMDVRFFPFADHHAQRYDETWVDAAELAADAALMMGRHSAVVHELRLLAGEHPYRESLHRRLMIALYRAGHQEAALKAYHAARERLVADLGVDPGPELQSTYQAILEQRPELDAPAPPGPSPVVQQRATVRSSLPAGRPLIGRGQELVELAEVIGRARLVTLTGAGGIGKTSLAAALAHRVADRYPGGAVFVDLAPVSHPEMVLPAIAAAMGLAPVGTSTLEAVADALQGSPTLLVLDNFEHVVEAARDVAILAEATAGCIVVTSRLRLRLKAEEVVVVPPLSTADDTGPTPEALAESGSAIDLFIRSARSAGASLTGDPAERRAIGAICRALDGVPLAIELAASRARVQAPEELARSLADSGAMPRAAVSDVPERQQTMDAAVTWSVERLTTERQQAFAHLAVCRGSFDVDAASAIIGQQQEATIGVLDELLDASLLLRESSPTSRARFRMLEPIRAVALARQAGGDDSAARARHAGRYVELLAALSPPATGIGSPESLFQLREDHANVLAAVEYLTGTDPGAAAGMLDALVEYSEWAGRERDLLHLAEIVGASATDIREAAVVAQSTAAWCHVRLGALRQASVMGSEAATEAEHVGTIDALWAANRAASDVARESGDRDEGLRTARRMLDVALASGRPVRIGTAHAYVAWSAQRLDDWQTALAVGRRHAMPLVCLRALGGLGAQQGAEQDFAAAEASLREALGIARQFDATEQAVLLENNLAMAAIDSGQLDAARALIASALRTVERIDHRIDAAYLFDTLGRLEAAALRWSNAAVMLGVSVRMMRDLGAQAEFNAEDADVLLDEAQTRLGARAWEEAMQRADELSFPSAISFARTLVGGLQPLGR